VLGACWPSTKFWRTLVVFNHFWDFDRMVEDRAPRRSEDHRISPPFAGILGFRIYVMGMEYRPMCLTHV
jgi:hypothetical protein